MVVTLLTDFGLEDEYAAVVKGVILGINPSVTLVDISHELLPGDIRRAGWLLSWAWRYFPRGSVHLAVVDPGVGSGRKILCLEYQGHFFLAPDNGLLTPILREIRSPRLTAVTQKRFALKKISSTFHGRDIFAPAAAYLSKGTSPRQLGDRVGSWKRFLIADPVFEKKSARGEIIAFDRYGSAITNLPGKRLAPMASSGQLNFRVKGRKLSGLKHSYADSPKGSPLAVIGSRGLLEIAVNLGSARSKWRLQIGDPVTAHPAR